MRRRTRRRSRKGLLEVTVPCKKQTRLPSKVWMDVHQLCCAGAIAYTPAVFEGQTKNSCDQLLIVNQCALCAMKYLRFCPRMNVSLSERCSAPAGAGTAWGMLSNPRVVSRDLACCVHQKHVIVLLVSKTCAMYPKQILQVLAGERLLGLQEVHWQFEACHRDFAHEVAGLNPGVVSKDLLILQGDDLGAQLLQHPLIDKYSRGVPLPFFWVVVVSS